MTEAVSPTNKKMAGIHFKCKFDTAFGQTLNVVGNRKELGDWEPTKSTPLYTTTDTYPLWETKERIMFPRGVELDYKYIIKDQKGDYIWEYLPENRHINIGYAGKYTVYDEKDTVFGRVVQETRTATSKSNSKSRSSMIGGDRNLELKDIVDYDINKINKANSELFDFYLFSKSQRLNNDDRIILVTSLLPFTIEKINDSDNIYEKYSIKTTDENLIYLTLYNLKQKQICHVSWVGILPNFTDFSENELDEIYSFLEEQNIYMVMCTKEEYDDYWIYFDKILLPVFITSTFEMSSPYILNVEKYFNAFHRMNKKFGDLLHNIKQMDDLIMINDITLSLVPNAILQKSSNSKVGIYFHIYFPSSDVMKAFPNHTEILKSILLCDVIGFHVFNYARNFITILNRDFGLYYEIKPKGLITLNYLGRYILLHIMHAGIDTELIDELMQNPCFSNYVSKYKKITNGKYVIASFDNSYELTELLTKFEAFKALLKKYPDIKEKIILVQMISYNKEAVNKEIITKHIKELTDQIGNDSIYYQEFTPENPITVQEQLAIMEISNIFLILQMWRGLCSLANQFLYLHKDKGNFGLILSENVGVSSRIGGCLRVNAFSRNEIMKAMETLYKKPMSYKSDIYSDDLKFIKEESTFFWIKSFFSDLKLFTTEDNSTKIGFGMGLNYRIMRLANDFICMTPSKLYSYYKKSSTRLFFLDYENTLQETEEDLGNEILEKGLCITAHKPKPKVIKTLNKLLEDPNNHVFILTGRPRRYLDMWFKDCPQIGIGAEYGFFYRPCRSGSEEYQTLLKVRDWSWMDTVKKTLQGFTEKTEGSVVNQKEASINWSFKNCNQDFGYIQANELSTHLKSLLGDSGLEVSIGKDYVDVKLQNINKGFFISKMISKYIEDGREPDFIFAAGDDTSDEEMFKYLNYFSKKVECTKSEVRVITTTVGKKSSAAKTYVNETGDILELLDSLVNQR